jgi:hypothetical protein
MPAPAIATPILVQLFPLPATVVANSNTLPIRPGFRPYTDRNRGKRYTNLQVARNLAAATAPGTAAPIGVFGAEFPLGRNGVDTAGRILPGIDPSTLSLDLSIGTTAGAYAETIRVSGGAGTALGFCVMLNAGSGYDPATPPAVTFANAGAAAATACVSREGRVTGLLLTNAGTWSATASVTIAAPAFGVQATAAVTKGEVTTVNTHIPFAAHAPTTAGGAFWAAIWRDRLIAASANLIGTTGGQPTAAQLSAMGLDGDQHVLGLNTAPGFTVATGTNPDGTTTIGVLTLGVGIPNGDRIQVIRGLVKPVLLPGVTNGVSDHQIKGLDFMWLGGNATAGAIETSVITAALEASY